MTDMYSIPYGENTTTPSLLFLNNTLGSNDLPVVGSETIQLCFSRSFLSWPSIILLWISLPFKLWHLLPLQSLHGWTSFGKINLMKTLLIIVQVIITFILIFLVDHQSGDTMATAVLRFLTMLLAAFLIRLEYMKGQITSGPLTLFWLFTLLVEPFVCRSPSITLTTSGRLGEFSIVYYVFFSCAVLQFILMIVPDMSARIQTENTEKIDLINHDQNQISHDGKEKQMNQVLNPYEQSSFLGQISFQWILPLIINNYRRTASSSKLQPLRVEDTLNVLLPKFFKLYDMSGGTRQEKVQEKEGKKPMKLWRVFMYCVGKEYFIAILIKLGIVPIVYLNPIWLSYMISFLSAEDRITQDGIVLSLAMFLTTLAFSFANTNFVFTACSGGWKAKSIVSSIVYRKSLELSGSSRKRVGGQMVSLMSVDSQKIQDFTFNSPALFILPVNMITSMTLLWQTVGVASLVGLAVLVLVLLINSCILSRMVYSQQRLQMGIKDGRFKMIGEVLAGMKVLKLYAWELLFEEKISATRRKELDTIFKINILTGIGSLISILTPFMVTLAVIGVYILSDPANALTPDILFYAMALINLLNTEVGMLPSQLSSTIQGIVSFKRIADFLQLEERDGDSVVQDKTMKRNSIEMEKATYSWDKSGGCVLKDISLTVPKGSLVAVVGAVGSGKSSLISSFLGDMFKQNGSTRINGSIAYVPQQAWILHSSLKDNIVFGKAMRNRAYQQVVEACALKLDLEMLPGGDETEIGEKGINLSGGQKQRVSLARSVYQDEDIYLLDDPLSAVDAYVGKHIFDNVVGPKGLLKSKTRVFVTHGIPYLPHCDVIYVMKNGRVSDSGSYEELLERGGAFAELVTNYLENEASDGSDNETEAFSRAIEDLFLSSTESRLTSSGCSSAASSDLMISLGDERTGRKLKRRKKSLSRRNSTRRYSAVEDEAAIAQGVKLIKDEKEEEGNISFWVVKTYIKACQYYMGLLVLISFMAFTVSQVFSNLWLGEWTDDEPVNGVADRELTLYRLKIYVLIGVSIFVFAGFKALSVSFGCYLASKNLHRMLLSAIIRAPMSFFDTTPLGRVMNRFSKDVDVLDMMLPMLGRGVLVSLTPLLGTIFIISYNTPLFILVIIPLMIAYFLIQRLYIASVRQWKRMESVSRSPILNLMEETSSGISSVRAYGRQEYFIKTCDRLVDRSQQSWFYIISGHRWGSLTTQILGSLVVLFTCLLAVLQEDADTGTTGLSITLSLNVSSILYGLVRVLSELETHIVSVERIDEYLHIDSEASLTIAAEDPPVDWPEKGEVQVCNYSTRYRQGLDLVLKDLTFTVRPREKVGIVGRTGAGKSSLSLALFRIIEKTSGCIYIDGRPTDLMGLHALRGRMAIIPQDPVVFHGSLRNNLDPFGLHSDLEVWQALEQAHLKDFVQESEEGLNYECGERGESLSIGQRQLLCLARALLKQSKILVLDEATSAVDFETDSFIQETIKTQFTQATVLTVAHRLHTVLYYDRIMVLDQGTVVEMDTPENLLANRNSVFYGMAKNAGLV